MLQNFRQIILFFFCNLSFCFLYDMFIDFFFVNFTQLLTCVSICLNTFNKQSSKYNINNDVLYLNDRINTLNDRKLNLNDRVNTLNVSFSSPRYMLNNHKLNYLSTISKRPCYQIRTIVLINLNGRIVKSKQSCNYI